jgi:DNA-binding beta-propeller fold protein YncE
MRQLVSTAVLGACALLVNCAGPEPVGLTADLAPATPSKQVIVSPSQATLDPGQTQQFSAQLLQDGKQKKAAFTWSSSAPAVATVSSTGLVTAVSGGDATITATASPSLNGTAHVVVTQPPPHVVATIPLGGNPFGSTVSSNGTGWIGQLSGGTAARLDIAATTFTGSASTGGGLPVQLYSNAAGTKIYAANFGGIVASINTSTLAIENTVQVAGDAYGITATPAGDTVFVGITDGPIYKIDLASQTILNTLSLPTAGGYHFEWNQAHTLLYAAARGFDGGRVFEINPFTLEVVRTFETGGSPQGIALSADGSKLFIAAEAGDVIVWDVAANAQAGTITTGCQGYGIVRTPDNSRLYVSCVLQGLVVAVNPTTGAMIAMLNVGGRPRELSFDAGTRSVLVPNESGWVDIIR